MGTHRTRHRQPARRRMPGRPDRLAHGYCRNRLSAGSWSMT